MLAHLSKSAKVFMALSCLVKKMSTSFIRVLTVILLRNMTI